MYRINFDTIPFDNFHLIKEEWDDLFCNSLSPCLFFHHEMIDAIRYLPQVNRPTHFVLGRDKENLLVLGMPIIINNTSISKILELFSFRGFDHIEPIIRESHEYVLKDFIDFIKDTIKPDVIIGNAINSPFFELFKKGFEKDTFWGRRSFKCPYVNLPENIDELINTFRSKKKWSLKKKIKLANEARVSFRVIDGANNKELVKAAYENLLTLHRLRFESLGNSSLFLETLPQKLHSSLVNSTSSKYVTFCQIIKDNLVIGTLYGFRSEKRFCFFMSGFHPEYLNRNYVGQFLFYKTFEYLIENNVQVFDFLRGTEEYKFYWADKVQQDYNFILALNFSGKLSLENMRLKKSIKRRGRLKGIKTWLYRMD